MIWWWTMPVFQVPIHFPLSGAVTQDIETSLLRQSSDAAVELDVIRNVASYGKQIGRLNEAVLALAASTGNADRDEVNQLREVQNGVDETKRRHGRGKPSAERLRRDLDALRQHDEAAWQQVIAEQAGRLPARPVLPAP